LLTTYIQFNKVWNRQIGFVVVQNRLFDRIDFQNANFTLKAISLSIDFYDVKMILKNSGVLTECQYKHL